MPAAAARPPRDDTECLDPDDTVDRPGQATRRRLLVRNAGLVIDGGLATAGGYAWRHGPGGALSYEAKRLRALRDDPMGAETALSISAIFTESPEFPKWFQWKYGDFSLRWPLYEPRRTPAELTNLFADYAESHAWAKNPGPPTPKLWIGRHGGPAPADDMILNIAPDLRPRETEPLNNSVNVHLWYL